ncbi:MAG: dihydropteroate synthase [Alphaproteobacteria bacterium]|nr:dihydropteroate synthase [Alphaproteobacteria bacterium]
MTLQKNNAKTIHKTDEPQLMGIVNVTPDSFSDGGKFYNSDSAIEHGLKLISEGAHVLDIGGESSRPGAQVVDIESEIRRVVPVIKELKADAVQNNVRISIDTRNAKTMEAALDAGADIINDISALTHDPQSVHVAASAKKPVILMHMRGTPQTMQGNPQYNNVVEDIIDYFKTRISFCETHRIDESLLILDPGIGFGKTLEHNLLILRNIKKFHALGCPLLLGTSRKSFIAALSQKEAHNEPENTPPNERLGGSISSALWGLSQGVQILRVHDVKETLQAIKIYRAISAAAES